MIEKGLILTGNDAELLGRKLSEIKTRAYEESGIRLDDTQPLDALVSCYGGAERRREEKEALNTDINPLRKCLVLGTVIGKLSGAKNI